MGPADGGGEAKVTPILGPSMGFPPSSMASRLSTITEGLGTKSGEEWWRQVKDRGREGGPGTGEKAGLGAWWRD